jgi:hypothetical protein
LAQELAPEQESRQLVPLQVTFCWHEALPEHVTVLVLA